MIVRRADTMGVCMGVRRALSMVEDVLRESPGVPVFTLGPLIHNRRVVEEFRARGVVPIEDPSQAAGGVVVIRAHGIGRAERAVCSREGVRCVDATCPHVLRIHRTVEEHDARGYHAIIVGDAGHGEVKGIRGYARRSTVISSEQEARAVALQPPAVVVSQTTFSRAAFAAICEILRARDPGIVVVDTTCQATEQRRQSVVRLAGEVDAILVIGGRESANTRWLFEAARGTGLPSWLIEGASEIPPQARRFERVGISAGASTPDAAVDEVERALRAMEGGS
jgi:4-hydroxy-3-methylbut-2-en-1-yl diphosphate reductase